jgi:hypothetical protein
MVAIDFGRQSKEARYDQVSALRNLNCFVEDQGDEAKTPLPVYRCPGLKRWDQNDPIPSGVCRGMEVFLNTGLYAVLGTEVWKFDTSGNGTQIGGSGTIPGADSVFMARNMRTFPHIAILTASGGYYYIDTSDDSVSAINDSDLPTPNSLSVLDRYVVFSISDGTIYHSALDDATSIEALAFAIAESAPDGLERVFGHGGFLYAFGQKSLEIWQNVGTTPFAFSPLESDIDVGTRSPQSVTDLVDTIGWVDQWGIVRVLQGGSPRRISTHAVERAIQDLTQNEREGIHGMYYVHEGHGVFSLTSDQWTWEYDRNTGVWHERESKNQNNWIARHTVNFDGTQIAGSQLDGALYEIDPDTDTDGDDEFTVQTVSQTVHQFPAYLIFDRVQIDAVTGVSMPDGVDPDLTLDWSDDGGVTWSTARTLSLGDTGDYQKRLRALRLGRSGEAGRIFRIRADSRVFRALMNADAQIRPVRR